MAYGPHLPELWRRAAALVGKILKGAQPWGDLPVEQPMRFELVINLKTAQALGLTIPPHLLVFVDEVIKEGVSESSGAQVVGMDNSAVQLATAHRLQREYGLALTLIHGNAEQVPYPDARFDLAVSEYGVSLWADPYRGVPEVARILRPVGGDPEGPAARSSVGAPQERADSPTSARG